MLKDSISSAPDIKSVTPGKWLSKNDGTLAGLFSSSEKSLLGMKSVHVKEPSWVIVNQLWRKGQNENDIHHWE